MKGKQEKIGNEWQEVEEERDDVQYLKWETAGTEVEGILKEVFQGKTAKFAKLDCGAKSETGDSILTMVSVPSVLKGKLTDDLKEKRVKIVYLGPVKFQSGKTGKDFKVFVKEGEAGKPAPSEMEAFA